MAATRQVRREAEQRLSALVGAGAVYLNFVEAPSPFGLRGPALFLAPVVLAGLLLAVLVVALRIWAKLQRPDQTVRQPKPVHADQA